MANAVMIVAIVMENAKMYSLSMEHDALQQMMLLQEKINDCLIKLIEATALNRTKSCSEETIVTVEDVTAVENIIIKEIHYLTTESGDY